MVLKNVVLKERFLAPGEMSEFDMYSRVANFLGGYGTKEASRFYNVMAEHKFLPNTPTLVNAGREGSSGQLAACFVLPIEDSMEGIFTTLRDMAIIQKTGGGVGYSFSRLRPKNDPVHSSLGTSSGPISFMKAYDAATDTIKQGGVRRGANMGILRVDHPDIEEFITCKEDLTQLNNFNISVGITDAFMNAVMEDGHWHLMFGNKVHKTVQARELFNKICEQAWKTGEPGIVFLDKINETHPIYEEIEATNPCVVGDTLIQTVEGQIPIKDLVGKTIDVYCVDENYDLTIRRAYDIRKTRENANLVKVVTTKGEVVCTPDHKFYTRNRGYVEAKDLKTTDKLVALNKAPKNQKYCKVYITGQKANKAMAEHRFIANHYTCIDNKNVHHVDNNSLNNVFSNLEVMEHGKHSSLTNIGHPDWCDRDPKTGQFVSKIHKKEKEWNNALKVHPVGVNMRLIEVVELDYVEDVYDMTVEDCHNFFANNVLIHNCGEQPLLPYEACNLGSINLSKHVKNGRIEFEELDKTIFTAVRFLDNAIDKNKYPLPQIREKVEQNRKIGLGVMGYADMLIKLGLVYGSPDALNITYTVAKHIQYTAERASNRLAEEKGSFPALDNSTWNVKMRNATVTTIAPTGTISILAECSGGIEPIFSPYYFTNRMGRQFLEIHPLFESLLKEKGLLADFLNIMKEYKDDLSKFDLSKFDAELHRLFVPAHSITPEQHIQVQSIWQKYTHNAVSKTINLPSSATVNDVKSAYMDAFNKGCKGVTVYRDGSRGYAVLSTKNSEQENKPRAKERDLWQSGVTTKVPTGCGNLWITINEDSEGNVNEVFIRNGDDGGCPNIEGEARLISLALRSGIPLEDVLDQLSSVKCPRSITSKRTQAKSCSDAVARTIREYLDIKSGTNTAENSESENICPNCGESLGAGNMVEGCITCRNCGWSQCG